MPMPCRDESTDAVDPKVLSRVVPFSLVSMVDYGGMIIGRSGSIRKYLGRVAGAIPVFPDSYP